MNKNDFLNPFKNIPVCFFFRMLFLLSIVDVVFCMTNGAIVYSCFLLSFNVLLSFVLSFILKCLGHYIGIIYKFILYAIALFMCCVDLFCVLNMDLRFGIGFASIIAGTNLSEAREFLTTFVDANYIMILLAICTVFYFIPMIVGVIKVKIHTRIHSVAVIVLLVISVFCVLRSFDVWKETLVGKLYLLYKSSNIPKLSDYEKKQDLIIRNDAQPATIVIVIGESFSKSHSSLYGYEKDTNPYMESLRDKGKLLVFNNVEASAIYTTEAFKGMMSTYHQGLRESVEWYKCPTIIGIAKQVGYYTSWVSNQCMTGVFENPITEYASLCDESFFVGKQFAEMGDVSYDESVLNKLEKEDYHIRRMFFVHLMGSHESFNERFPVDRVKYTEKDYIDCLSQQRQILADYDNSIVYNDSIVNEIIKLYEKEETVLLYYSDHALDLFESSSDYYGHSKQGNPASVKIGKQIPFMIFVSDRYKKKFPQVVSSLHENVDTKFNTENLIYFLMDIMGVKFTLNDDVKKNTLLK